MAIRQVYLPIHLMETWRTALDSGSLVAAAFIYFRKAFDISDEAKKRFWHHWHASRFPKVLSKWKATVQEAKWNQIRYALGVHWHSLRNRAGPNTCYSIYKRVANLSPLGIAIHVCWRYYSILHRWLTGHGYSTCLHIAHSAELIWKNSQFFTKVLRYGIPFMLQSLVCQVFRTLQHYLRNHLVTYEVV